MERSFQMNIVDVFRFSDGQTVIMGTMVGGPPYIKTCHADLVVRGKHIASLPIEGERTGGARIDLRSVTTLAPVPQIEDDVRRGDAELVFHGNDRDLQQ
jgi:hypothetical protein